MRKTLVVATGLIGLLAGAIVPAAAQERGVRVSLGYSFVTYLEEGGGSAPLGAFLSLAGKRNVTFELDLGWQQDSETILGEKITLNTFTATAGPQFSLGSGGKARPFLHVLGGLRHDRIEGESNTAWGGLAGGGVDIQAGQEIAVRLEADFQVFFDDGENLKTLRLGVGLTF
jgi:opacity protein-like surface antigen